MNISIDDCLDKISGLRLEDYNESICVDDSNPVSPLNETHRGYYSSSDCEEVQSAPELHVEQRKFENERLYPLDVKLYWTYEEVERGTSKKQCKRQINGPNKLKRKKFVFGGAPNPFQAQDIHKHEMDYDADNEI